MYGYFFTYQDALPENSGFPLFGGVHFIWIAGIAMSIFLLCKVYLRLAKNQTPANAKRFCASDLVLHIYAGCYFDCHRTYECKNAPVPSL